jgi:dihydrofolate reductase
MSELTADLFVTLDGFASGEDVGAFYGCDGPQLQDWIRETGGLPQLIVMGRVTYVELAKISMSSPGDDQLDDLPKVVFSNTLREPLAWRNTRLVRGDLAEGLVALKRRSPDPLRSIGSVRLVKSMMRLGLVDRLRLAIFPLTLGGAGRAPAFADHPRSGYELIDSKVLDSRLVMLEYRPARDPSRV